ncbi:hypothetical protein FNU76_22900 [Chitinimonas arctica]|uniref:Leucine-rich repeat domain-containing protein n=1 Tax=Chitinimonas arctica TaxID=2594795 RepID=A0A516SMX3_9NEIS|nr:hypothetical protein FNU76_22900 [Chitinimonas arctica]
MNTGLTALHLNHNPIGTSGAQILATALAVNTYIAEFDLASNNLIRMDVRQVMDTSLQRNRINAYGQFCFVNSIK